MSPFVDKMKGPDAETAEQIFRFGNDRLLQGKTSSAPRIRLFREVEMDILNFEMKDEGFI